MFVLSQGLKMLCSLFSSSEKLPSCSETNPRLAGWRRDYCSQWEVILDPSAPNQPVAHSGCMREARKPLAG